MKKLVKIISVMSVFVIMVVSVLSFSGCNAKPFGDWNYTYNYAIIQVGNKRVLHKVSSWCDSESESAMIKTKCCNNEIWFSLNNGEMYKEKPDSKLYDYEC